MTVSVLMITYKHEKYIEEAINSVLMQKCSFDIELIIADDNSPDNTEIIVNEIIARHPKGIWIKYTKHKVNRGMNSNFYFAFNQCKGEYIAVCEGDDYWTDPLKLQKQVDFLNLNPEYFAVTANTQYLKNGQINGNYKDAKEFWLQTKFTDTLSYNDILRRISPHTTTWLFRNEIKVFPDSILSYHVGDFPLYLIIANLGKIKFVDEIMSVYRVHENGAIGELLKKSVFTNISHHFDMLVNLNEFFEKKYSKYTEEVFFIETHRLLKENPSLKNIGEVKKVLNNYLVKLSKRKITKTEEFKLFFIYINSKAIYIKFKLKVFLKKHLINS